ncbi:unnamed protein product [Didymodactylos carnosus]|uniref:G-protein coupled receptors family 1 profile domain-containing protein n=1 Tax=Didymodactylos carnosus TaxID=1234261 RepID=A0A814JNU4_9BILA|nr:unnamed protein product [Didymodactylos carnosus]CAF3810351.1 unnamed protein product [Didymodactylos carnosus]
MIIMIVLATLSWCQTFYCYDASLQKPPLLPCISINKQCQLGNNILLIIIQSLGPVIIMTVFSLLTLRNVQNSGSIVMPSALSSTRSTPIRAKDRQLITMLLFQTALFAVCTVLVPFYNFYMYLTFHTIKSIYRLTIENFILQLCIFFTVTPYATAFYLYAISGEIFRRELRKYFVELCRKIGIQMRLPVENTTIRLVAQAIRRIPRTIDHY